MKKIYLFCNAGMSTSMLASMMQEYANKNNLDLMVEAISISKMNETIVQCSPDIILLGPQVKYLLKKTKERFAYTNIPIDVIDISDYGLMNSENVINKALKLLENK